MAEALAEMSRRKPIPKNGVAAAVEEMIVTLAIGGTFRRRACAACGSGAPLQMRRRLIVV